MPGRVPRFAPERTIPGGAAHCGFPAPLAFGAVTLMSADVALARNGTMMNGGGWGNGSLEGYGGMEASAARAPTAGQDFNSFIRDASTLPHILARMGEPGTPSRVAAARPGSLGSLLLDLRQR